MCTSYNNLVKIQKGVTGIPVDCWNDPTLGTELSGNALVAISC